ncbi:hypothetical protein EYV94_26400 [Puteibacter caeruleilacunae]|nr:hypothetical protein EYV94_26400 [Puteibacter caeruleilacunae]
MKKLVYCILFLGVISPLFSLAQDSDNLKSPQEKSWMIEVNFDPFNDDGVFSFDQLQAKYRLNNKTSLRLGLDLNYKHNSTSSDDYALESSTKNTLSERSFLFGFRPGIEFRILENTKISPYWGAELAFLSKSSSSKYVDYKRRNSYGDEIYDRTTLEIDGAWRSITHQYMENTSGYGYSYREYTTTNYNGERSYSSFGFNLLLGTDVYLIKNLYFGFEVGLGYNVKKYKKIKLVSVSPEERNHRIVMTTERTTYPSSKSKEIDFYSNNAIRVGVYF